jgi:hypothetical protein
MKRALFLIVGVLTGIAVGVSGTFYSAKERIDVLEMKANEAETLAIKSDKYEMELESMTQELERLKDELEDKEELEKKVERIEEFIDLDAYTDEDLNRAKDISQATPLDFKTALIMVDYANTYQLDVSLLLGLMELESNFNQYEVGTSQDRGYMQIIPSTEKWLAQAFSQELGFEYDPERIYEPEYNIGLAVVYLNTLKKAYGNNYDRILSEYNRGPYNLQKYYEKYATYETSYSRVVLSKANKYLAYNE